MKKILILLIPYFFLIGQTVKGQFSDSLNISIDINDSLPVEKLSFIKGFLQDGKKLLFSPANVLKIKKAGFWFPVVCATIYSLSNDEKIYSDFKKYQGKHAWVDKLSPVITYGGDNKTTLGICGLFYFGGMIFKNEKAK